MNEKNKYDLRREEAFREVIRYHTVINEIRETAEQLCNYWDDESGHALCRRAMNLADEMDENCERLKRWIGSGSLQV